MTDTSEVLSKETFAIIKPVYKQKFFVSHIHKMIKVWDDIIAIIAVVNGLGTKLNTKFIAVVIMSNSRMTAV